MAPVSGTEPASAVDVCLQDGAAAGPLLHESVAQAEAVLGFDRPAVGWGAELGELSDLWRKLLGPRSCLAVGDDELAQPDAFALLGHDLPPGQDEVEGPALADEPEDPKAAAVKLNAPGTGADTIEGVAHAAAEAAGGAGIGTNVLRRAS